METKIFEYEKRIWELLRQLEAKIYERYKDVEFKALGKDIKDTLRRTWIFISAVVENDVIDSIKEDILYEVSFKYRDHSVGKNGMYNGAFILLYSSSSRNVELSIHRAIKKVYGELTHPDLDEKDFVKRLVCLKSDIEYFVDELYKSFTKEV